MQCRCMPDIHPSVGALRLVAVCCVDVTRQYRGELAQTWRARVERLANREHVQLEHHTFGARASELARDLTASHVCDEDTRRRCVH